MKLWKTPPSTAIILRYLLAPPIIGLFITIFSYPSGFKSVASILYVLFFSYCIGIPSIAFIAAAGRKLDRHYPWLKSPFKKLVLSIAIEVFIVLLVFVIVKVIFLIVYKQNFDELFKQ